MIGPACRVLALAVVFLVLAPVFLLARRLHARRAASLPIAFHRVFLRLFSVQVAIRGTPPSPGRPTLVLANHVSWLDIPVLGGMAPLSFIAKSEIAGWPIIGTLARLQDSIFLDRQRKAGTALANAEVAARLRTGDTVLLFSEGTTGDGIRLLPFRSSLVGAARAALADGDMGAITLQPLAIRYTDRNGLPLGRREMPEIAWYGDMELGPHLKNFLRGGPWTVTVIWGEPIRFDLASNRKRTTALAETAVRDLLNEARSERRCS